MLSTLAKADSFRVVTKDSGTFSGMKLLMRVAAASVVVVLAGCGGSGSDSGDDTAGSSDSSTTGSKNTASPATGKQVNGKGYSFSAPEGWKKPTSDIPGT